MKRGALVLPLIIGLIVLSSCIYNNGEAIYPKILTNDFTESLIEENTKLRSDITDLKKEISQQEQDIEILIERLEKYYDSPIPKSGPYDWIKGENIIVKDDKIIIELRNASVSSIADTHSLEPLIHKNTNVIEIKPESTKDIHLGDLAAYESNYANGTILHRVISIGIDEEGWYVVMKGDNNPIPDPGKVRFEQIRRIVVGVIY
ncbi:MAG: hypothetical protein KKF89_05450 [Nanoarchaeota archaeon]|nr:hypothetical protein [Nanoarchaeota archaeon]MBU1855141.1 hypothetical protein [Nanoarchaeota archaeon]